MAKIKEGAEITISGTVISVDGDAITVEINDGNEENHHCITLTTAQLEGKSVTGTSTE